MMPARTAALLALGALAALLWSRAAAPVGGEAPEPAAAAASVAPAPCVAVPRTGDARAAVPLAETPHAAGLRVAPNAGPARAGAAGPGGLLLPDGRCLPPLNGVRPDDPIPAIERAPFLPPIGAVTGKVVDDTGIEWWVTADGSAFTTRWVDVVLADGTPARVVRLDQCDALIDGTAVALR